MLNTSKFVILATAVITFVIPAQAGIQYVPGHRLSPV